MKKLLTISLVLVFAVMLILSGCSNSNNVNKNDLPIINLAGSFSIDINDLKQVVGDADYVFVAKVNNEVETIYKDKITIETQTGAKEIGDPYTKYSITVIDNIKGKLKKNKEIQILKQGGVSEDNKSIVLYHDDELLQAGKYHIISAYAQPDGSLLVSGPNSSLVLDEANENEVVSGAEYKEYKKAFENQIATDRKRFKSIDEE